MLAAAGGGGGGGMTAADTRAALQMAAQVNSIMGAASNVLESTGIERPTEWLGSLRGNDKGKKDEEEGEKEEDKVQAVTEELKTYSLRMCIHSAENLPRDSTYVLVRIGEGSEAMKEFKSEVVAESQHPVWEYCVEHEVTFGLRPPKLEVLVLGKRMLSDRFLGAAAISLPAHETEAPQRQDLPLANVPASFPPSCSPTLPPKLLVVWQLSELTTFVPDLNRVAEMDHDTMERETHTVALRLMSLVLRRPMQQSRVGVSFKIRKPTVGLHSLPTRTSPSTMTHPRGQIPSPEAAKVMGSKDRLGSMTNVSSKTGAEVGQLCSEAAWFADDGETLGWTCESWAVRDSRVALLSHLLEVSLHTISKVAGENGGPPSEKILKLGFWREPLGDLMDSIYANDRVLRFDAKLCTKDGQALGLLRMELDVFTDEYHRPPPKMTLKQMEEEQLNRTDGRGFEEQAAATQVVVAGASGSDTAKHEMIVQMRAGLPAQEVWQHMRTYYCTIFADGLPAIDSCSNPYVRITMGSFSERTDDEQRVGEFNNIRWNAPVTLASKVINRRARIELFVKGSPKTLGFKASKTGDLLGESTVYDVAVGRLYWMHLFGGAPNAPKKDVALQMARGAHRPASTYKGTVAVFFGTSRQPQSFFQKLMEERCPCRLIVRLYYGANLYSLANKRVRVLVQVAGCRLPDEREAARTAKIMSEGVIVRVVRDAQGHMGFSFANQKGLPPRVVRIEPGRQDLQPMAMGDTIDAVDGRPVSTTDELKQMVAGLREFQLTVRKKRASVSTAAPFAAKPIEPNGCCAPEKHVDAGLMPDARHFNVNLLSFPGFVDQHGVLRFDDEKIAPPSRRNSLKGVADAPPRAWVERRTPRTFPLRVPPGVTHAYMYVVAEGEEAKPPTLFGRLRLGDLEPSKATPKWKMMRYDASVCDPPDAHWPCAMAGFILGSAALTAALQPSRGSPNSPKGNRQMAALESPGRSKLSPRMATETRSRELVVAPTAKELATAAVLPRATRSPLCAPMKACAPEVSINVGSPGASQDVVSFAERQRQKIFCHIDVLAARELPAMDDDGLSNSCYMIQVLDKCIINPGNVSKSLSPSFMHRVTIPIFAELSPDPVIPNVMTMPLPPVVVSMRDRDETRLLGRTGPVTYETMGTVLIKHMPTVRDGKTVFPMLAPGPDGNLDLNRSHRAMWHALDKPARCLFDSQGGGHDASWHRRPRVLLAVGYSLMEEPQEVQGHNVESEGDGVIRTLHTQENARISINIDLLGLRNLPEDMHHVKLHLSSFWEGQEADFDIGSSMFSMKCRDPNFPQEGWEHDANEQDAEWRAFWQRMRPFLKLEDGTRNEVADNEDDGVPTVLIDDVLGIRVKAPTYEVPVIPYLQQTGRRRTITGVAPAGIIPTNGTSGMQTNGVPGAEPPGNKAALALGNGNGAQQLALLRMASPTTSEADSKKGGNAPFLLLPTITFRLRNFISGMQYGSLTTSLNNIPMDGVEYRSGGWAEKCIDQYHRLPEELRRWRTPDGTREGAITFLQDLKMIENAYTCCVDIFASESGDLTWDSDMHVGRCLRGPLLFSIQKDDSAKVTQYFNPADWMCGDEQFKCEPFDERVAPSLWAGEKTEKRNRTPLGPAELFKDFLNFSRHDKTFLQTMKTGALKRRMAEEGWRAATHLAAPEFMAFELNPLTAGHNANLQRNNQHTFMRSLGHIIHHDDRDSRILCRLRMDLPIRHFEKLRERIRAARAQVEAIRSGATGDEGDLQAAQQQLSECQSALEAAKEVESNHKGTNFLVIKFHKPGLIIWAAPDTTNFWDQPGSLLFAVKLQEDPDTIVPVTVPSFDLRFQFETAWLPRKTLITRFRNLEVQIGRKKRQMERKNPKNQQSKAPPGAPLEALRKAVTFEKQYDDTMPDNADGGVTSLEGYDRPISVAKGAFVCRVQLRTGALYFDRKQARGWYRSVLGDALPELRDELSHEDDVFKEEALAEFMNLRKPMVAGNESSGAAMLKGHINVQRADRSTERGKVNVHHRPLSHLWAKSTVFANITVLTAHKLELGTIGLGAYLKTYLVVKLGSEVQTTQAREAFTGRDRNTVNFYDRFTFETALPGRTKVIIEIWHKGILSDTCIGSTSIDLEDRWMVLKWREFRTSTQEDFLRKTISPPRVTYCGQNARRKYANRKRTKFLATQEGWTEPDDPEIVTPQDGGHELRPHRAPEERLPIEFAELMREDEDTAAEEKVGILRLLVDLTPQAQEDLQKPMAREFVIVLTIWEVNNIQVFKDFGERNDAYVQGRFRAVDYWGREYSQQKVTDTHKFARHKASFNWRWVFPVSAPVAECSLELTLLDSDRISEHDAIYDPKVYPLDHMLLLAYQNAYDGKPSMGALAETVVFDSWPDENKEPGWFSRNCRCCRRLGTRLASSRFARLRMDVEVLPKEDAAARAKSEEGQVAPPQDRLNLSTAISNMSNTASIILGPTVWRNLQISIISSAVVITLLIVFACLYYIINVYILTT